MENIAFNLCSACSSPISSLFFSGVQVFMRCCSFLLLWDPVAYCFDTEVLICSLSCMYTGSFSSDIYRPVYNSIIVGHMHGSLTVDAVSVELCKAVEWIRRLDNVVARRVVDLPCGLEFVCPPRI